VKWLDCLLVSASLSTTLFTLYVLGGSSEDPVPGPPMTDHPDYRYMVIHHSTGCRAVRCATDAHFVVTADGEIHSTVRWRRGESIPSTGVERIDRYAVVVAVDRAAGPGIQRASMDELMRRLRDRFPTSALRIVSHAQVERVACGHGLHMPASGPAVAGMTLR
jgi:hypothetical protein